MADNNAEDLDSITIRLPASVKSEIEAAAKSEERSVSGFLRFHIQRILGASEEGGE